MRFIYLIKFIVIVGITSISTYSWAQTCSTIKNGLWTDPTVWDCGYVPSDEFSGTINVRNTIIFPPSYEARITGQVSVSVTGAGRINFGFGGGSKLILINANSTLVLETTSNIITGGTNAATLNVAGKYCTGPFSGSNQIRGNRTISFASPACTDFVLPVTLISFSAKPEGDRVQLAWATSAEQDADRFVVERSADLGEYVKVGQVAAKGTSNTRQNYGLTDMSPLPGVNYYRLRQIDRDGTSQTFKPVSVIVDANEFVAVVYPNPAEAGRVHLRLQNADNAVIRLLTLTGQPVESKVERVLDEADLLLQRPLPTGIYLLEVQANGQKRVSKVLIR